jgi:hypothetical protein
MLIRKLVVVGLVGFVSFAANIATAEDAVDPRSNTFAVDGVDLVDPAQAFTGRVQLSANSASGRFSNLAPTEPSYRRQSIGAVTNFNHHTGRFRLNDHLPSAAARLQR